MKAVLLCAGYATRMGALTARFPKSLLPVAGRPILDDLVDQLIATERIDEIVVVANRRDYAHFERWRRDRVDETGERREPDGCEPGAHDVAVPIRLLDDGTRSNEERLGAVGDLAFAIEAAALEGPLVVAAGDNLFRFDLAGYLDAFACEAEEGGASTMVLLSRERDRARLSRSGVAEVAPDGRLLRLWEKPASPPSDDACPPLYLLGAEAIAEVRRFREARPNADAPGHLIAWLAEHSVVRTHRMDGERLDVGDLASYRAAEAWLAERAGRSAATRRAHSIP